MTSRALGLGAAFLAGAALSFPTHGQGGPPDTRGRAGLVDETDLSAVIAQPRSELADIVTMFEADKGAIERTYRVAGSPARSQRLMRLCEDWQSRLAKIDFRGLSQQGKVDAILLRERIKSVAMEETESAEQRAAVAGFVPFAAIIERLEEDRRLGKEIPASDAAGAADQIRARAHEAKKAFEASLNQATRLSPALCVVLRDRVRALRAGLEEWRLFYDEYDPQFSWWTKTPVDAALTALREYAEVINEKGVGITKDNPDVIVGTPIGRDALLRHLRSAFIPYTPEELIAIAEREFAWCREEYKKAARDMGLGEDWRAALAKVKLDHPQPGEQPREIRAMAEEAVAFLREKDLVTVPAMCEETWRMEMLSAERQKVTPFFTGGEVISVAFPTCCMEHQQKVMSLRANNRHFSRATVQHELIPGHHLQQYACSRWRAYREPFRTPFWTEGWALYWEMKLWDVGFPKTPENRVGMLFWRSHRCARIVFSLKYHLGDWEPQRCIDYLVEEVGHERSSAEGEVRRSVAGGYGPLYQLAYMIGGLQFRALSKELSAMGWSDRRFHDAVLRENNIPVEMVRALLIDQPLSADFETTWRFDAGE